MSQSSSAQREPSMEEILSSIRKIIEDGDSGQSAEILNTARTEPDKLLNAAKAESNNLLNTAKTEPSKLLSATKEEPASFLELAKAEPGKIMEVAKAESKKKPSSAKAEAKKSEEIESILSRASSAESAAPEVEQFRKELAEDNEPKTEKVEDTLKPDLVAPLESEPEGKESDTGQEIEIAAKEAEVEDPVEAKGAIEINEDVAQPEQSASDTDEAEQDVFSAETGQRLQAEVSESATSQETSDASVASDPVADEAESETEASAVPEVQGARPIISETASRKIAASFEQLSEAFAESRKKSFDEMAEEMIRPMLQDWLDNNLPLLVERLVREEIERVARGGAD